MEKHPDYASYVAEWSLLDTAIEGSASVKAKGEIYLPKPASMDTAAYEAYKLRAQFPAYVSATVSAMMGVMHGSEIAYDLPDRLEFIREDADGKGRSLERLHELVSYELLTQGRVGLLVDAPREGGNPYITLYRAPRIVNWDEGFYVLDESGLIRNGYQWDTVTRYRELGLEEGRYYQAVRDAENEVERQPYSFNEVPFTIASWHGITHELRSPPLIQVANEAIATYQLNADYRLQLYMTDGQRFCH